MFPILYHPDSCNGGVRAWRRALRGDKNRGVRGVVWLTRTLGSVWVRYGAGTFKGAG